MLREGLLAEDTGAGERQAGSQGEVAPPGWVGSGKWQWLSCLQARDTPSPQLLLPQQSFQTSFGPLKTAGAVMDIPEAHKQGYRGRYVGHTFLPSSHQKRCVGPPAAGKCHVSGQEPFVCQVSLPQEGAFPRGAAHAA